MLPQILEVRVDYAASVNEEKNKEKLERQKGDEEELRKGIERYKLTASGQATEKIAGIFHGKMPDGVREIIENEMNMFLPIVGIKKKVDSQKKRILICQIKKDKILSDVIYKMLSFNNVPDADIIYTNCDNEECRIPNQIDIYEYLRKFFVESYSDRKIFVIYVTSDDMAKKWGAVTEVGAGWIARSRHDIFNIHDHRPQSPLNVLAEWQTSHKINENIIMDKIEFDKFIIKIRAICDELGYRTKDKKSNERELAGYVSIRAN